MTSTPLRSAARAVAHRPPFALALVLALLAPLLTPANALAQTPDAARVEVDLEGPARFQLGDDPAWADPDLDDGDWDAVEVPYNNHPAFDDHDGFGWYRVSFDLPAEADGANLVAALGFVDDADEAYLNGVLIGRSGSFPPNANSQWFEQRLYPVPADAPVYGGRNVLALRVYDLSGAGGWYQGPLGIYSKDVLRERVYGIDAEPADAATTTAVDRLLRRQRAALAAGDVELYLDTLHEDYVHDGHDRDRQARRLQRWVDDSGGRLELRDTEVEVLVDVDGRLLVDTNRAVTGTRDGAPHDFRERQQEFLVLDPDTMTELGNRSRFFRDTVESELEVPGEVRDREYVVYLPPSYYTADEHDFPVVYLLHGINGGSREWEPRDFGARLDALYTDDGLAESIVVMPDGESLWYSDWDHTRWRTMFVEELVPQVDAEYRTLDQREFRGLSGVSMGGFGAFSLGWSFPELFSSIASHMGSLTFAGGSGNPTPVNLVQDLDADLLDSSTYFFDACEDDDYNFDNGVRTLSSRMTERGIEHTAVVYAEGRHNDDCWLPRIADSFGMHSAHVRANGLVEPAPPAAQRPWACTGAGDVAFADDPRVELTCLVELGLVAGYPDGTYRPALPVSRQQVAAVLTRVLDRLEAPLPAGPSPAARLHDVGILQGTTDGDLALARSITRGQLASLVSRALAFADLPLEAGDPDAFRDLSGGSHDDALAALHAAELLAGYPDGTARAGTTLNRHQLATVLARLVDHLDALDAPDA
ncbi:alpha/beta hydrolase-fold protein [Egicoccus halophilus]|uniref:SLH domain-containing protein n=1 Tax=Egicoccus halophilus TaxID=1670830 RepID=A0A8J3ESN0_9ACTN|nr:alpha/beta hydrolase-fold protein [Egicoccus halophilus]GGI03351.1 hypothetical protein GCM10011354_03600 [Egicoccus halophilus]